MKTLIFSIVVLFLTSSSSINSFATKFYPEKQALKMVKNALKEKDVSILEEVEIANQNLKSEPVVIYRLSKKNGDEFYAVFTQACGRYEKYDYLMTTDLNFVVEKIKVLKYRSEHGGEIASQKWLSQFENYSSGELRYKKEISALSGATISAKSFIADVPKVLKILKSSCEKQ